jgi:hypothetical protein
MEIVNIFLNFLSLNAKRKKWAQSLVQAETKIRQFTEIDSLLVDPKTHILKTYNCWILYFQKLLHLADDCELRAPHVVNTQGT